MSVNGLAFRDRMHMQNEVRTTADGYTLSHLHPPTKPNSKALLKALGYSRDQGLPDIASCPVLGRFLALQCKAHRVKHALEIGTLGELRVTTIKVDRHHRDVAQTNIDTAGVSDRASIRLGAGLDVLPQMAREVAAGDLPKFDFVYPDADKQNNWNYIDKVLLMCEPGALIFVDNMIQYGGLVNPEKFDRVGVAGARQVVEMVGKDDRLDGLVMQVVGEKSHDGFLIAVVK